MLHNRGTQNALFNLNKQKQPNKREGLKKISNNSIARKLISPHLIIKKADNLPKTISFMEPYIESDEDFHIRKLNRAYKNLLNQGENLTFTAHLKESKISSQELTSVVESYAKSIINQN